jgi:hypothetical protein
MSTESANKPDEIDDHTHRNIAVEETFRLAYTNTSSGERRQETYPLQTVPSHVR